MQYLTHLQGVYNACVYETEGLRIASLSSGMTLKFT